MTATSLMTENETREVSRQRRSLEQAVADATEDVAAQQLALDAATDAAKDISNARAEKQVVTERAKMRELAKELAAAQSALAEFNQCNPTEAAVKEAERIRATEAARIAREKARAPFIENRKEAIQLLTRLVALDTEARQMLNSTNQGVFGNIREAVSLADLLNNWLSYDRDADGLAYIRRALSAI